MMRCVYKTNLKQPTDVNSIKTIRKLNYLNMDVFYIPTNRYFNKLGCPVRS